MRRVILLLVVCLITISAAGLANQTGAAVTVDTAGKGKVREIVIDRGPEEKQEHMDFDLTHLSCVMGKEQYERGRKNNGGTEGEDHNAGAGSDIPEAGNTEPEDSADILETGSDGTEDGQDPESGCEDEEIPGTDAAAGGYDMCADGSDGGQDESAGEYDGYEEICLGEDAGDDFEMGEEDGEEGGSGDHDRDIFSGDQGSGEEEYIFLGEWTVTAYCPCELCCGEWATGCTASGVMAVSGHTVACGILPFGTQVMIDGTVYTVEDTGVEGEWIDIFFDSHEEASAYGAQIKEVYLVG